ncbi:nickel-dependent lactate racemase [Candidatus Bathyarchaeota archaeon]|nr:MAG: nickel-dependent lactate racemase [Candidatus Bathyarchaeota archaeon]
MVEIWLPYGSTEVCLTVSPENLLGVVEPKPRPKPANFEEELEKALQNPINAKRLDEIVKPNQKIAIAFDKNLNPNLLGLMISKLWDKMKVSGIPASNVTVIIGCKDGEIPSQTEAENFLQKIPENFQKKVHNPNILEDLVEVGLTNRKTRVFLNKSFWEADVKILLGKIGLHPYAGFYGGSSTILSICGLKTIHQNYVLAVNSKSRIGVLEENPVYADLVEIAKLCKVDYALNVIENEENETLKVFCGEPEKMFLEGVKFIRSFYEVEVDGKAEVVVVSPGGTPYDQNFYCAYEAIEHVLSIVKDGGVIVLVAECSQGLGGENFHKWMVEIDSVEDLKKIVKKNFDLCLHRVFQLMDVLKNHRIIVVSALPNVFVSGVLKLRLAKTVNDAVEWALRLVGKKSKILVLPYAKKVLPVLKTIEIQH